MILKEFLKKPFLVLMTLVVLGLGFYSRYYTKSVDSVLIKNRQELGLINKDQSSASIEIDTLCENDENSRKVVFIEVNGFIPINNEDVEIVSLEGNSDRIQIVMNEARQFIYYHDQSKQDPNPTGHELNSVQDPTVTAIDATIVIYPMLDQGIDQVVVDSYVRSDSLEHRSQMIVNGVERSDHCFSEIGLGSQAELLKNVNVSFGVAENDEATNIKLIIIIRFAVLVLLFMTVYLFLASIRKAK